MKAQRAIRVGGPVVSGGIGIAEGEGAGRIAVKTGASAYVGGTFAAAGTGCLVAAPVCVAGGAVIGGAIGNFGGEFASDVAQDLGGVVGGRTGDRLRSLFGDG